ncbi:MAG: sensor histidine kinase, partial [Halobaculum sp.]
AVHGDDTATTQSANATADPAETAGTTADAVATTGVNAEGTDTPDVTDEATDTADAADSTEVSGEITDVSTDPTDTADAADSTDVNADTGEGDVESHAGDGAGGAFRAGGEPHTLGRADDGRSEDAPSRAATAMTEPAVTLRTDERPRIAAINEAFASLAEGPVVGHPPTEDRLPAAVADRLRRAVARARADERGPSRHALTVDRPEGRRHYVAHDAPYDGGARSLVVFTEVTALKRSETQTAVLTRILRHNLRNEVTVARGYAERIEREAEDAGLVRAARRIVDATATLAALGETAGSVQSVLTGTETQWTTHDLPDLLARVASRVADRHGVNVAVETVEPDGVVGTQHLERALVELAENAVLHGGGDPRLSAERLDGAVRITVRDDGPGIPDPEWAVVAERREITQLRHASGLGLWLVRWVVENNGGRLERHEDDETCVVVHLPRE